MDQRRSWKSGCIGAALTVGLCSALSTIAAAQSPSSQPASSPAAGELPASARAGRPLVAFDELTFDLGFDAEWRRRQVIQDARSGYPFRDRQTNSARSFEETVGAHGEGTLVDERFATYRFDVRTGWHQDYYHETRAGLDRRDSPDGFLLQYDTRLTLLPAGKVTIDVLASQLDDRVSRPFLPSLDRRRERYGASLLFNDRVLPMRLSFEDTFESLDGTSRQRYEDEQRGARELRYEATWQPTQYHSLRLDYEYNDRREQFSGTDTRFDTVRNYLTLNHVVQFGSDHRSRFDTLARFQDESGDLARDMAEFAPQLRLQHTDQLATRYRGQYLREEFEGVEHEIFRADAGLTHQPCENLGSSADLYGLRQELERGGDSNEWGAIGSLWFNRDNSLGRFSSTATYTHTHSRADDSGSNGVVMGESVTLKDPLPVFLARTDVVPISILVTDGTRRVTYFPVRDYVITRVGRYTSIRRVPTGRIVDNQTVLVSYTYRTSQGLELNRDRVDVRVEQRFTSGWTPYYAGSIQDEDIDRTRFRTFEPRRVNRHRAGLAYRQPRWSASSEYEFNDDSIDPYQGLHLNADCTFFEDGQQSLGGTTRFSFLNFEGTNDLGARTTSLFDAGLTYRYALAPRIEAVATGLYRYEDDELYGITHGVDVSASLNWRIGLFTALLEVEYKLLDLADSSDGSAAAWIKLRREIPLVARHEP
ncbi:MAG: hypothetical protein CHACPFDD_00686 [Phycisphaerae bacterium]|nr:hypothetical protein [Phycisphaerae bacterium]